MLYSTLGRTGLRVSRLSLGAMTFGAGGGIWGEIAGLDRAQARYLVAAAVDQGVNLIDSADAYSQGQSEVVVGQVLSDLKLDESRLLVATKVRLRTGPGQNDVGLGRSHIISSAETSLRRLGRDHIDLFQLHDRDALVPIEETLRALDDLVRQGKVRYIGNSNFPAWRLAEAEFTARAMNVSRFVSCQDEYSLLVRDIEKDLLPAAQEYKLGLLPFFPLASGLLTGKYKRGAAAPDDTRFAKAPALKDRYVTPRNEDIVEKLQAFAKARGHSMLELAFSWLAARPQVSSVIAGATRVEQIEQNVKAIEWQLSADDMAEVDRITKG